MTPEEFVVRWRSGELIHMRPEWEPSEWWESNELVQYAPDIVKRLEISETSRYFLATAGLPRWTQRHFRFDFPPNTLPVMLEVLPKFHIPDEYRRYRLLGKRQIPGQGGDGPVITAGFFCLDEKANGQVVHLEFSEGLPVKFANSSIEQFAEFLLLLRQEREWHRLERDKLEQQTYREDLWSEFQDKVGAYQNQIIEQLEHIDYPATQEGHLWEQTLIELKWGE